MSKDYAVLVSVKLLLSDSAEHTERVGEFSVCHVEARVLQG